jgi:hypothetical protein
MKKEVATKKINETSKRPMKKEVSMKKINLLHLKNNSNI